MIYLQLVFGFVLLIAGGDILVRAAVAISRRFSVPPLLVGLTVVAFGTSAPELTVAVSAALKGSGEIVSGTVIGSNIANILLILGVAAVITPIRSEMKMIRRDGLTVVAVSGLLAGLTFTGSLNAYWGGAMIAAFIAYVVYSYVTERTGSPYEGGPDSVAELTAREVEDFSGIRPELVAALPALIAGTGAVIFGADTLVEAASALARTFGVSEAVIGLSLVAIGTSLPELAISVIAALRGEPEMALGNAVGSNISNILMVLGGAALVAPIPLGGQIAVFDVWIMLAASLVLIPVLVSGQKLSRREGAFFLACYVSYITVLYLGWPADVSRLLGAG